MEGNIEGVMEEREEGNGASAIVVRGADYSYGSLQVLKGLNMTVPSGSIYGLLGSSGCGKTTLLRCVLGRLILYDGHVDVLGRPPGSRGHTIPGKDVGYMPQELALFGDFTMLETLYYFGILYGMSPKKIRERSKFLVELLELPTAKKTIRKLSGGQQRRVSFAVAMLQEPPLLILDEPTVGVDPLLRAKIWGHLLELVSTKQTTIVITTHYIEEARQAHVVGLMRDGLLLAESEPDALIESHGMGTLEEVFLKLCRDQDLPSGPISNAASIAHKEVDDDDIAVAINEKTPLVKKNTSATSQENWSSKIKKRVKTACKCGPINPSDVLPHPRNVAALFWKNITRIYRNLGLLFFQFFSPTLQMVIFCLAIGQNLTGVNVAIVNNDVGYYDTILHELCTFNNMDNFGSLLVSGVDNSSLNLMLLYDSKQAIDQVKRGNAWAAIVVPENFTKDLTTRVMSLFDGDNLPSEAIINGSIVEMYADVTNLQMTFTLEKIAASAVEGVWDSIVNGCSIPKEAISSPIKIHNPPVYGNLNMSYTDYIAPGMIISITFGISIGLTALSFVVERKEGLIDRTWVAGVNVTEMVFAQIITQFFILFVQIILLVIIVKFAFNIYMVYWESLILVCVLAMLQGLAGMSYGLLISSLCKEEVSAMQIMAGSFYPILLLSGIIWPLEGMPTALRYISYSFPSTYAAEAMRSIMGRGWGLDQIVVWRGILMTIGWFSIFILLSIIGLKLRK